MLSPEFFEYLAELSQNNNKDWFDKNKPRYESQVKLPFEKLVAQFIEQLETIEGDWFLTPKDSIHRIYRDTRFAKDKTPYKNHVSAVFTKGGKKNGLYPGYYLHIEAGQINFGGGAYFLEKEPLWNFRNYLKNNLSDFETLVNDVDFNKKLGGLLGEKNARVDAEFKETAAIQPLILNKQFYFMAAKDPKIGLQPNFMATLLDFAKTAKPFNEFCRNALNL
jgi:uncharacterized protein (TIGR02453 family)